jgi:hypothetical protein
MNRPLKVSIAILIAGGSLWAATGLVPPSTDTAQAAYRQAQASGALFWDREAWVAWSVPGTLGHDWTCRVHLDWIADPGFLDSGFYECNPWPWAGWFRGGPY